MIPIARRSSACLKSKTFSPAGPALLLFPLKNFFDVAVLDDCDALIEIEKPLNHIGNRIEIDVAARIAQQRRQVQRSVLFGKVAAFAII